MKKLPIHEASDAQIEAFVDTLQLDRTGITGRSNLLALLATAHEDDFIFVNDVVIDLGGQDDEALPEPQQTPSFGTAYESDPKWRVVLGTTDMPGGKQPVPVGVNGKVVVIQRNMTVDVPHRFYLALQSAVRGTVTQDAKTREIIEGQITNYPITQILKAPSEQEIADWEKRTGSIELGEKRELAA
jgi:hypothetical protein